MDKPSDKYWTPYLCLALALTTLAVFWQVRNYDFVNLDDQDYVTENYYVRSGLTLRGTVWAFTTPHAGNWHPLTSLSHMLDCQLFGIRPGGHHLTNLLLHIANTLLLFVVLKRMTHGFWQSAFVAAAFALHPLHVESVAWISERKDVLSTLFWMLTLLAYHRYVQLQSTARYLCVLLLFALGLMAKPMLVTLPFVLLLLDYWPLDRLRNPYTSRHPLRSKRNPLNLASGGQLCFRLLVEKLPLLVLSVISSVVTFLVQQTSGAVKDIAATIRIANALVSYLKYAAKMVWPARLSIFYPHPSTNILMVQAVFAAVVLLAVSTGVILLARSHKYLLVGWLWYLGTLVPVIGLVQVGTQAMADRYTYVPLIGLFIIVGWAIPELLHRCRHKAIVVVSAGAVAIVPMTLCTCRQVGYWQNSYHLFTHALAVTENNYVAHHALGTALFEQQKFDQAILNFQQTLTIKPDHANAPGNLGLALLQLGEYEQAEKHLRQALARAGRNYKWHFGLAETLRKLGRIDEAILHFTKAVQFEPNHLQVHISLAHSLLEMRNYSQAIAHYNHALKIKPDSIRAQRGLANALFQQNSLDEAITQYQRLLQMLPFDAYAHNNLGVVLARKGELTEAVAHFAIALQNKPDSADAHNNLGSVLARQGEIDEAVKSFSQALRLKPDWTDPMNNLAWLLATHKHAESYNPPEAVRLAERASKLTNYETPAILDTLAAAYAADGNFPQAVATAEKAIKLADPLGQKDLSQEIHERLLLYKASQPYIPLK